MNQKNILKYLQHGIVVFVVYIVLLTIIRLITKNIPEDTFIFDFFTQKDLLFGAIVAIALTFSYYRRNRKMD